MNANLLKKLSELGARSKLYNIAIYGNLRCIVEKPSYLKVPSKGYFGVLDVFALKQMGDNYFGDGGSIEPFFSLGNMLISLDDEGIGLVGENVVVMKSKFRGATISQDTVNGEKVIHCVPYEKGLDGWELGICRVEKMSEATSGTDLENFLMDRFIGRGDSGEAEFRVPDSCKAIQKYSAGSNLKVVDAVALGKADNGKSLKSKKEIFEIERLENGRIDLTKIPKNLEFHLEGIGRTSEGEMLENYLNEVKGKQGTLKSLILDEENDVYLDIDIVLENLIRVFLLNWGNQVGKEKGIDLAKEFVEMYNKGNVRNNSEKSYIISKIDWDDVERDLGENLYEMAANGAYVWKTYVILAFLSGIEVDIVKGKFSKLARLFNITEDVIVKSFLLCPWKVGMLGGFDERVVRVGLGLGFYEREEFKQEFFAMKLILSESQKSVMIEKNKLSFYNENRRLPKRTLNLNNDYLEEFKGGLSDAIHNLDEMGIITIIKFSDGEKVILTSSYEKQIYVWNVLAEKGLQETGVSDEAIEEGIERYQNKVGFKLEDLQAEAIKLCKFKASVLSGCAGSGKTTTSECIKMVWETELTGYDFVYGAPTGKACRRLSEVVGGTVRTLHSLFSVMVASDIPIGYVGDGRLKNGRRVFILDEMAMCNFNLLYEVCRNLTDEDIIIFLGDIKQLPPIGTGFPFAGLMGLLPCVELGVSKRSAEGSLVNYNCSVLSYTDEPLEYDEDTFRRVECGDVDLVGKVKSESIEWMKKGYAEDDIQVISAYVSDQKASSTKKINPILQKFLREKNNDKIVLRRVGLSFYKNDRVIHTSSNLYGKRRFKVEGNELREVVTTGIVNGDLGKVLGIVDLGKVKIKEYDGWGCGIEGRELDDLKKTREEREETLEEINKSMKGLCVSIYDVDLGYDVVVIYQYREGRMGAVGSDIANLDLAYALTCHKMQGSQSQVVIIPLESKSSPYFVNKNMVNTMITRSQGCVSLVGSVDVVLGEARKVEAYVKNKNKPKDLLEWIV